MLTPYEITLLERKIAGETVRDIAKDLKKAEQSIKNNLGRAYLKLGLTLSSSDVRYARDLLIEEAYAKYKEKMKS